MHEIKHTKQEKNSKLVISYDDPYLNWYYYDVFLKKKFFLFCFISTDYSSLYTLKKKRLMNICHRTGRASRERGEKLRTGGCSKPKSERKTNVNLLRCQRPQTVPYIPHFLT